MGNNLDYLAGQVLSLVFYIITLVIYNRARKEYIGGKIAAAIKLVMGFLCIRLLADSTDYFAGMFLPINADTVLIIKIVLNMSAMCVLFFGGLRFFVTRSPKPAPGRPARKKPMTDPSPRAAGGAAGSGTVVLDDLMEAPADGPDDRPSLGRYEILGQIGKGAMGVVYKGRDPKLQRLTAIKTIRFGDDFDEDRVDEIKKQFNREAELVAKLSHPNIVAIYDVGEDLDLSYLAMEYLEGESLERYTREADRLSVGQCIQVLIQVCDALEYAHSQDIVHRDIKPANIMLLENGVVKVTDFGVARSTVGSQTRTGVVKGTPYYMSPEQAKGEKVTGVSDIFSLGVVFYQLLTGRRPFIGESLPAILHQIMSTDPVPASKFNARVDKTAVSILNRALEKDKHKRYQSAAQMAAQLRVLCRYRGEDESAVCLEVKWRPRHPAKPARKTAPAAKRVATQPHKAPARPERAKDIASADAAIQKAPAANGKPDQAKAHGVKASSPWRRRIAFVLAMSLLISIPALYLWSKSRSVALKSSNLAAFRIKRKAPPKKTVPPAPLVKAAVRVGAETAAQPAVDGNKVKPHAVAASPAAATAEKQRDSERLAREAEDKRKEQERLARIAEEKRKEEKRQADRAARQRLEKKRRAREMEQRRIEQARLAEVARQQELRRAAEITAIEQMLTAARAKLAGREYGAAAQAYQKALAVISASEFKSSEQHQQLNKTVAAALQSDAIVYGANGYVLYKNKWFAPEDYEKQLLAEGFVKYKGNFILYKKLGRMIEALAVREVRAFLRGTHTGKQIHKKQIDMRGLSLKRNTLPQSSYEVLFNWEIWTFTDIAKGRCSVEVRYDAQKDEWKTLPARTL